MNTFALRSLNHKLCIGLGGSKFWTIFWRTDWRHISPDNKDRPAFAVFFNSFTSMNMQLCFKWYMICYVKKHDLLPQRTPCIIRASVCLGTWYFYTRYYRLCRWGNSVCIFTGYTATYMQFLLQIMYASPWQNNSSLFLLTKRLPERYKGRRFLESIVVFWCSVKRTWGRRWRYYNIHYSA